MKDSTIFLGIGLGIIAISGLAIAQVSVSSKRESSLDWYNDVIKEPDFYSSDELASLILYLEESKLYSEAEKIKSLLLQRPDGQITLEQMRNG